MNQVQIKLASFLQKYGSNYSEDARKFIIENFEEMLSEPIVPDILKQIYSELGLIPREKDMYYGFLDMISANFGLDRNILEIGCGFYPTLSKYIDLEQQRLNKGSITAYDGSLVTTSLGKIKLYNRMFKSENSVENYDLIIGTLPCDATELIIRLSNREKKECFLALCGCTHFSTSYLMFNRPTQEDWFNYVFELAEYTLDENADIDMTYLDSSYNFSYPILIKKYKNR